MGQYPLATAAIVGPFTLLGKPDVSAATAAALDANTRTGNVLTADANGALAVDGLFPSNGDRILVKNEANGANNGIHVVTDSGSAGTPWVLTRASDANASYKIQQGLLVKATGGTVNAGKVFRLDSANPLTINSSALTFTDTSAGGLSSATPQALGTASPGSGSSASRDDHVHSSSPSSDGAALGSASLRWIPWVSGFKAKRNAKTADYTLTGTDYYVPFSISSVQTATLPSPSTNAEQVFVIKNLETSSADLTVSGTIGGVTNPTLIPGASMTIISTGSGLTGYDLIG